MESVLWNVADLRIAYLRKRSGHPMFRDCDFDRDRAGDIMSLLKPDGVKHSAIKVDVTLLQ